MDKAYETQAVWSVYPRFRLYTRPTSDPSFFIELGEGDFIIFEGREHGVKIGHVTGRETEKGPRGMAYLPWRPESSRWGSPLITFRGDPRWIVLYPSGLSNYGQHAQLQTVERLVEACFLRPSEVVDRLDMGHNIFHPLPVSVARRFPPETLEAVKKWFLNLSTDALACYTALHSKTPSAIRELTGASFACTQYPIRIRVTAFLVASRTFRVMTRHLKEL